MDLRDDECAHVSWTGEDATDLSDPGKVWVCDSCGRRAVYVPDEYGEIHAKDGKRFREVYLDEVVGWLT